MLCSAGDVALPLCRFLLPSYLLGASSVPRRLAAASGAPRSAEKKSRIELRRLTAGQKAKALMEWLVPANLFLGREASESGGCGLALGDTVSAGLNGGRHFTPPAPPNGRGGAHPPPALRR